MEGLLEGMLPLGPEDAGQKKGHRGILKQRGKEKSHIPPRVLGVRD